MSPRAVYTIGHSTRTFEQLVHLLQAHGIQLLCDIRLIPRSARHPHFNQESLQTALPTRGIQYRHFKDLGGMRNPRPDSENTAWENAHFRGYADYMQTEAFRNALNSLRQAAENQTAAVMCAEGNYFQCHRRLTADALSAYGIPVLHISSQKTAKPHTLTPFARLEGQGVIYPGLL